MIPKIIHYIWLGGNAEPKILKKCKASWKKFCPDFEIKRWDETNLDINCCKYCKDAYDSKKFAFASDVLRLDVLKNEGGIYLDIDVEIIKPLNDLLNNKLVCGFESEDYANPGVLIGCEKENSLVSELYEDYLKKDFVMSADFKNQLTLCKTFTEKLKEMGFEIKNKTQIIDGVAIYSSEYFSPKSLTDGKIRKTKNTYSIHHYAGTWIPKKVAFKSKILQLAKRLMGEKMVNKLKQRKKGKNAE